MRRVIIGAALAATVTGAAVVAAAPAEAANPACMTRAEFSRIHHGQTQGAVRAIVGSSGRVTYTDASDGYRFVSRSWAVCGSRYGFASVDFSTTERADGQPGVYGKSFYA